MVCVISITKSYYHACFSIIAYIFSINLVVPRWIARSVDRSIGQDISCNLLLSLIRYLNDFMWLLQTIIYKLLACLRLVSLAFKVFSLVNRFVVGTNVHVARNVSGFVRCSLHFPVMISTVYLKEYKFMHRASIEFTSFCWTNKLDSRCHSFFLNRYQ